MCALFVAVFLCVVVGLTEAQMDRRRRQQGDDGRRTPAQRRREEEEERRRDEERGREQLRREQADRRRREQEERQRREEEGNRAIQLIQSRMHEQRVGAPRLQLLEQAVEHLPQDVRFAIQEQIEELRERVRAGEVSQPEE